VPKNCSPSSWPSRKVNRARSVRSWASRAGEHGNSTCLAWLSGVGGSWCCRPHGHRPDQDSYRGRNANLLTGTDMHGRSVTAGEATPPDGKHCAIRDTCGLTPA